jgi:hypothetical protein
VSGIWIFIYVIWMVDVLLSLAIWVMWHGRHEERRVWEASHPGLNWEDWKRDPR